MSVAADTSPADTIDVPVDASDTTPDTTPDVALDTSGTTPDTTANDTTAPDTTAPDTIAPDTITPDTTAPTPPCAAITVAEGLAVTPPLTLHLSGLSTTGDVATWAWSMTAPSGLVSVLAPGTGVPEPHVEAALAGSYVFRLDTRDKAGQSACAPAEVTVVATPGAGIHLELIWDDNTADPTLDLGADLDLHVFRADAVGLGGNDTPAGWFDPVFDCAWHNPDPVWPAPSEGAPNPAPRLLRRDDAGYGPEVVSVPAPEATTYVVGFHVWDDDDAIYLAPTEIRVWIDGVLKNKPSFAVPVAAPALWRVMTVTWPSGQLGFPFEDDGDFIPTSPTK